MLNCRELTRLIASDELAEARWPVRMGGWLHLLMCRHCRRYATQIRSLAAGARRSWGPETEVSARLDQLERRILERCLGELEGSNPSAGGLGASKDPDEPQRS